ncbi:unnamed protein product [Adineta ricciae]|uniref:Uncharacterized protein n=1 Tax=Adineta ricciae TaxID=249248 RepID=A0A815EDX0_ADIRI|nr:unnamed protein product [Adineta ricciae]CAF1642319.1 unnamed protein product [Adineta ricciae]
MDLFIYNHTLRVFLRKHSSKGSIFYHVFDHRIYSFTEICFLGIYILVRWIARAGQRDASKTKDLSGQNHLFANAAGGTGKQTAPQLARLVTRATKLLSGYPIDLSDWRALGFSIEKILKTEGAEVFYHELIFNSKCIVFLYRDVSNTALINYTGVTASSYALAKDGFEMQIGADHFGHFYLPKLLRFKSCVVNASLLPHPQVASIMYI